MSPAMCIAERPHRDPLLVQSNFHLCKQQNVVLEHHLKIEHLHRTILRLALMDCLQIGVQSPRLQGFQDSKHTYECLPLLP